MTKKVKKINVARDIFNKHLHLATTDGRAFRAAVRNEIMATLSVSECSSGALYNTLKKEAEQAGQLAAGQVGRKAKTVATAPVVQEPILDWAVVSGKTVRYAKSRSAARTLATELGDGWKVKKTAELSA